MQCILFALTIKSEKMSTYKIVWLLAIAFLFAACSKNDTPPKPAEELTGLTLVKTISNATHKIDIYTVNGKFETGYNEIFFQIKDNTGTLVTNATVNWEPVMHMQSMSHSCPFSSVAKKEDAKSVYGGYIVFQMAGNDMEYWELTIHYSINGNEFSIKEKITVTETAKRTVQSFQGTDNKRYVLALVEPAAPKVAINNMKAVLYTMKSMMQFDIADGYTIEIDPRMPSMGNHGSPNNVHLKQGADKMYHGRLSLTMTGYWKINLRLLDAASAVLKGEAVTAENESSSIFFESEF